MTTLQLTTHAQGSQTLVAMAGTLNLATAAEFTACLGQLLREGHRQLIVDAARLHCTDQNAVQTLSCVAARLQAAGASLVLACPSPELAALLAAQAPGLVVCRSLPQALATAAPREG